MMSLNQSFKGVWTALITPFDSEGSIAWDSFDQLVQKQANEGVKGIVFSGTTGEGPTLSVQEKLSMIRRAKTLVNNQCRIMAGTGGSNTDQSCELSRLAENAGADSLLISTPPYNKPSLKGLIDHFQAISKSCQLPICLYHVPGRTAQFLNPDEMYEICKHVERIRCIKEASADIGYFSRIKELTNLEILSGDDPTFLASLAVGGAGGISVVSNLYPAAMVRMQKHFENGEIKQALRIHSTLLPMIDHLFLEANPGPLKAALSLTIGIHNSLRLPLASVEKSTFDKLRNILDQTEDKLKDLS